MKYIIFILTVVVLNLTLQDTFEELGYKIGYYLKTGEVVKIIKVEKFFIIK